MNNLVLWKNIKDWLITSDIIEPNVYEEYIKSATIEDISKNKKAIVVNNDLPKFYLENISYDLNNKIKELLKKEVEVIFLSRDEYIKEKKINNLFEKNKNIQEKDFIFENFVLGKSNTDAFNAAKAIIENPGGRWNPLFIYGDSGLGKTHLLKAICNELNIVKKDLIVKYFIANDFRQQILQSLLASFEEIEKIKFEINKIDVLMIDDIHFLANSGKTNEIFFNIFNSFIENNKQIVITSDKFPELLNGFDKRLVSRFNQGLSVKIDTPDLDTVYKIVDFKSNTINLNLTEESKKYIASNFGHDIRKIEGIINRIQFHIIQKKENFNISIDLEIIQKILEDYSYAFNGEITVQKIKDIVSQNYGVNIKLIDSKNKVANVVKARHVSMYLTYEIMKKNYSEIGILFGGKDHTTVMNACNKIRNLINKDKIFKDTIKKIKKQISS